MRRFSLRHLGRGRAAMLAAAIWGGIAGQALAADLVPWGNVVRDMDNRIDWLRCAVGQRWNGDTCLGEALRLNHDAMPQVIAQANQQLGGRWRLPTRRELEGLLCQTCRPARIDPRLFPATPATSFWTGQRPLLSPRNYWSVNFLIGHSYGRFFPQHELAVRLVRDRRD
ncbi:DUF1566 domain-containing protein [Plastorhodobacter daqingensis]|uniref:DUF1566 domain-containing protein n=1 Tax=Plastorhodobacter daqingensis TaxID=1387281 RepID=A0ABW2UJG2_9RHOB